MGLPNILANMYMTQHHSSLCKLHSVHMDLDCKDPSAFQQEQLFKKRSNEKMKEKKEV